MKASRSSVRPRARPMTCVKVYGGLFSSAACGDLRLAAIASQFAELD